MNNENHRRWVSFCPRCGPERCLADGDGRFEDGSSYRWTLEFDCGTTISTLSGPGERQGKRLRMVSSGE